MFLLNGQPLSIDTPFVHNGISYPANWLRLSTAQEKQAIGITEIADPPPIDYRFYKSDGTKKNLENLKKQYISDMKFSVNDFLAKTDWYYMRKVSRNIDVPEHIEKLRNDLINHQSEVEKEINACKTFEDYVSFVDTKGFNLSTFDPVKPLIEQ